MLSKDCEASHQLGKFLAKKSVEEGDYDSFSVNTSPPPDGLRLALRQRAA